MSSFPSIARLVELNGTRHSTNERNLAVKKSVLFLIIIASALILNHGYSEAEEGNPDLIELRLQCEKSASKCLEMELPDTHEKISLQAVPQITTQDVKKAEYVVYQNSKEMRAKYPGMAPEQYNVLLQLTPQGRDILADLTEKNMGKRLAILIKGKLIMAPIIREQITEGVMQIVGGYGGVSSQDLKELAYEINSLVLKKAN